VNWPVERRTTTVFASTLIRYPEVTPRPPVTIAETSAHAQPESPVTFAQMPEVTKTAVKAHANARRSSRQEAQR
jgi:hypothetical protein